MGEVAELQEEDRLSKLADELLHQILCDHDTRVVVQTCVLSKRWVNVWTTLPCLNFGPLYYAHNFVTNFLNYRDPYSVLSTLNIDCYCLHHTLGFKILHYALSHNVQILRISNEDYLLTTCMNSIFIKTLHLTSCRGVNPMDWNLPNLNSLCFEHVTFGKQISGFHNLKELTLVGVLDILYDNGIFTIDCPNLQTLILAPDHRYSTFVVSAPKLLYFEFRSIYVPQLFVGDGFPLMKEVDIDIQIENFGFYNDARDDLTMQKFIKMLYVVRGTPLLKLSSETIQASFSNFIFILLNIYILWLMNIFFTLVW